MKAILFNLAKKKDDGVLIECKSTQEYLIIYYKDSIYYWPKKLVEKIDLNEKKLFFKYQKQKISIEKNIWEKENKFQDCFKNSKNIKGRNLTIFLAFLIFIFMIVPTFKTSLIEYTIESYLAAQIEELKIEFQKTNKLKEFSLINKIILNANFLPENYEVFFLKDAYNSVTIIHPNIIAFDCNFISSLDENINFIGLLLHGIIHLKNKDHIELFSNLKMINLIKLIYFENLDSKKLFKFLSSLSYSKQQEKNVTNMVKEIFIKNKMDFYTFQKFYQSIEDDVSLFDQSKYASFKQQHTYTRKIVDILSDEMYYSPQQFLTQNEWKQIKSNCQDEN